MTSYKYLFIPIMIKLASPFYSKFQINIFETSHNKRLFTVLAFIFVSKRQRFFQRQTSNLKGKAASMATRELFFRILYVR